MFALFALALITTDPDILLGGPDDVRPEPRTGVIAYKEQSYHAEGSYERSRYERGQTSWSDHSPSAQSARPLQVGDPVQLDDSFFQGPLVGGVGGRPPVIVVVRQSGHHHYRHWR